MSWYSCDKSTTWQKTNHKHFSWEALSVQCFMHLGENWLHCNGTLDSTLSHCCLCSQVTVGALLLLQSDAVTTLLTNGSTAFKWKLCSHWLIGLQQHQVTVAIPGPGPCDRLLTSHCTESICPKNILSLNYYSGFLKFEYIYKFLVSQSHSPVATCVCRLAVGKKHLVKCHYNAGNFLQNVQIQLRQLMCQPSAVTNRKLRQSCTCSCFELSSRWLYHPSVWIFVMHFTHWGRVTHICVSKLTIIGSDNGLSPDRRQAIIWTKAGILLIGPLRTNFNEISIKIYIFSFFC